MGENIHLEKHVADGVAVIRLDRPKVNALSSDMMRDLHAICDELAVDDTTRAVVVTGGRKNFAAGADISEFPSFTPRRRSSSRTCSTTRFSPWRTFRRSRSRPSTALRSAAASKSRLRPTFA